MKRVTFEVELDVDDAAQAVDLISTFTGALDFMQDEGHLMEDTVEYNIHRIVLVDIQDLNEDEDKEPHDFPVGPISWVDAATIADIYELVLTREEQTGHEIHINEHGTLRWDANPDREKEIMDGFGAKDLNDLFMYKGFDKNDPIIRELYKCIGYSIYGFWEIFYWEVNNEYANEYVAPTNEDQEKYYGWSNTGSIWRSTNR